MRKLTSFTVCCYVIGLLNRAQTNHKHKRKGMWFGCEQPFLFFLGGGGEGALLDIPKNGCGGDKSYFDLNHWHKYGLDTGKRSSTPRGNG